MRGFCHDSDDGSGRISSKRDVSAAVKNVVAGSKAESDLFQSFHCLLVLIERLLRLLKAKRRLEFSVILKVEGYGIQAAIFLLNFGSDVYQGNTGYAAAYEIVIGSLRIDDEVDGRVAGTAAQYRWRFGIPCEKILNLSVDYCRIVRIAG